MRYLTGSSACVNSTSVKRGVMCCGQFQSKASKHAADEVLK
jgi:hypothetical protein